MTARRGVLKALARMAALERDEARSRGIASAQELDRLQRNEQTLHGQLTEVQHHIAASTAVDSAVDVTYLKMAQIYSAQCQLALTAAQLGTRRAQVVDDRLRRELAYRQGRVKALEKSAQRRTAVLRTEQVQLVEREADRSAAGLGSRLRAGRQALHREPDDPSGKQ
jgi:hypothetical protein